MSSRRVESFLLRLVVDDDSVIERTWRGRIQHVSSGSEQRFECIQDMFTFISDRLPHEPAELVSEDDSRNDIL